jgi:ribulose-phosphate 3-epimerase
VSASLLAADPSALGAEVLRAQSAGVDRFHVDVMDGIYAPNLALTPRHVTALQRHTSRPFDLHLEVESPDDFLQAFACTGAETIIVQLDTLHQPLSTFLEIRSRHAAVGLALNRTQDLVAAMDLLGEIDLLVLMAVNPGFGGQRLDSEVYSRLATARQLRDQLDRSFKIAVDGGVNTDNAGELIAAGANQLITGTALFAAPEMGPVVKALKGTRRPA